MTATTAHPSGSRTALRDLAVLTGRAVRLARRDVDAMLTAVLLPVVILAMFVYVFGGAIADGASYVDYAAPGIILLCAGFGAASTAVGVEQDMHSGMVERLRAMPVAPAALLGGHVLSSLVKNLLTTGIVFAVAVLIGFRPDASPVEWLLAVGVLLLFVHAVAWAATFFGVLARTPETAAAFTFAVMFLPYVSSAFVPLETLPGWLRGFAEHQPVTPVIETVRGLLGGTASGGLADSATAAVAWCVGFAAVFAVAAVAAFRRRT